MACSAITLHSARNEIGVRMALGAARFHILRIILREGFNWRLSAAASG
jgi:hypothetical protein